MALIVEDGTIVANANSYNTVAEIRAYADARGMTLPTDDLDVEKLAIQAMDYLESFRNRYQGYRTDPVNQELQFPRVGVIIDNDYEVSSDEIPSLLKKAHSQATAESYEADLMPNDSPAVKKEKVDVLEVEYQESSTSSVGFPKVDALLEPLFKKSSGFGVRSVRV